MRRGISLLILFILILNLNGQQKYFSTEGKEILDPSGNKFLIKGINLGNWLVPEGYMFKFQKANSPEMINDVITQLIGPAEARKFWKQFQDSYITYDDIKFIKSLGVNSIRVPFNYKLFCDETYLWSTQSRGFELIDSLLSWCREVELPIILDMHCAPGGQTGDNIDDSYGYPWLFVSDDLQNQMIEIWANIADYYKNESLIIGYDLMNEPIAHYFEDEELQQNLEPLYKRITEAIRVVDTNHIVFLGGARWNTDFSVFGKPFDKNLVYEFHKYWMPPVVDEIQEYLNFRDQFNVPIYMGESGENEDEWVESFRKLLDNNNIGWHFWPYKKVDNERGPTQFILPEHYHLVIEFAEADRSTYKLIREQRPDYVKVKEALNNFIENSKFQNCFPNTGYLKALGFKTPN